MQSKQFPNSGWVEGTARPQHTDVIWREIHQLGSHSGRVDHGHVGTIRDEFRLTSERTRSAVTDLLMPLIELYVRENHTSLEDRALQLDELWCNQQRAGEYLIPHSHRGLFSFALWLQVPFTHQEELEYRAKHSKAGREVAGFSFYYTDSLGKITPYVLPVDRSWENRIVVFPGEMMHSVSPFYSSSELRITVSGNVNYGV